jgi:hypothetical protein
MEVEHLTDEINLNFAQLIDVYVFTIRGDFATVD